MMSGKAVRVDVSDGVAEVQLLGPGKGNALGPDFWVEMPAAMAAVNADHSVRAVVMSGSGEHFTYGLDLMAMMGELGQHFAGKQLAGNRLELLALIERLQGSMTAVSSCRVPVIAAITGWCIGGGVDLICATDVRVCSADARFSVRETRLAMVADLGTLQRLPRVVGPGHARELAFTGDDVDAARALRIGLVNDVLPDREATLSHARDMARRIAANSPLAVRGVKAVMDWSADRRVEDGLDYVASWNAAFLASEDLAEAVSAFAQKRPPVFKGT
jgi:enoyl-CoA hydratase